MIWTDRDDLRLDNWIGEHERELFSEVEQCQTLGPPDLDDAGIRARFEPAATEYWRRSYERLSADFRDVARRATELEANLRQQVWLSFALGLVLLGIVMRSVWGKN